MIGATRVSYSWHNDWFTLGLYECMYPNFLETLSTIPYYKPGMSYAGNGAGQGTHIGQMLNFAKLLMCDKMGAGSTTQIEFDILCLLGDPEQSPRTAPPQLLSATPPSRLTLHQHRPQPGLDDRRHRLGREPPHQLRHGG